MSMDYYQLEYNYSDGSYIIKVEAGEYIGLVSVLNKEILDPLKGILFVMGVDLRIRYKPNIFPNHSYLVPAKALGANTRHYYELSEKVARAILKRSTQTEYWNT